MQKGYSPSCIGFLFHDQGPPFFYKTINSGANPADIEAKQLQASFS